MAKKRSNGRTSALRVKVLSIEEKEMPELVWQERNEYLTEIAREYNASQNHLR
jgi:hypothetical protein